MKISTEITRVEEAGDCLRISCNGQAEGAAEWRPSLWCDLQIPNTQGAGKTYYVGRKLILDITVK